jgi:hypothetical protein
MSHAHTTADPLTPASQRKKHPSQHQHSQHERTKRGGLAASASSNSISSPAPQKQPPESVRGTCRSSHWTLLQGSLPQKPLWGQHQHQANTRITTAPCTPTQDCRPPWLLCTFLPTRIMHTPTAATEQLHHATTCHCHKAKTSSSYDASKEGTTP